MSKECKEGLQVYIFENSSSFRSKKILKHEIIVKLIAAELNKLEEDIDLAIDEKGKPFIYGNPRYFSLSYSKNMMIIVTDTSPVGVDIEFVEEISDMGNVINYFSSKEKMFLEPLEGKEKTEMFYLLWVLKESYIKAIGEGLRSPLDSFSVINERGEVKSLIINALGASWHLKGFDYLNQFKVSICAAHNQFPSTLNFPTKIFGS